RNYDQDGEYRLEFQQWINALWEEKDRLLDSLHEQYPAQH
ncbi:putative acyltransferase, partial [Pseudomonas amygdali pv. mori str. 301020]